jgi:hypothetical protein
MISTAPVSVAASATMNFRLGRCFHSNHAPSVTNTGAKLDSSVALATLVHFSDTCQAARSQAKHTPASRAALSGVRDGAAADAGDVGGELSCAAIAQIHSSGTASATRQKALATGLTSDRRTKIGAKAIAAAPASRARKASGCGAAAPLFMAASFVCCRRPRYSP